MDDLHQRKKVLRHAREWRRRMVGDSGEACRLAEVVEVLAENPIGR